MSVFEERSDFSVAPDGVRLFPLPNLVLFPHVVQPLHVFEPRYCQMVEDALSGDGTIAMGLLQPGWERDYEGRPQVWPVACLGKIVAHHRLSEGRFNLLVQGVCRAAIQRELPSATPYRLVELDPLEDYYPSSGRAARPDIQRRLVELAGSLLPNRATFRRELDDLLACPTSLGMLTDVFAYSLSLPLSLKQRLLSQWNVDRRAVLLLDHLASRSDLEPTSSGGIEFPPPFSLN